MKITIKPGKASGTVAAPPSKSMAHRMLIGAGLCEGVSQVHGVSDCEDVSATIDCLQSLGVECKHNGSVVDVRGVNVCRALPTGVLPCRESGSTLRFFLPLALLSGNTAMFRGSETLMQRPMSVYENLCRERGLLYLPEGQNLTVRGPLEAGIYRLPGNVSSQFISGLLFALPLCEADSTIRITTPIESRSYLNLTLSALRAYGVTADFTDERTIHIPGRQHYQPCLSEVEGDYSGAAFLEALNLFGGAVNVTGLRADSEQGDSAYRRYFPMLMSGTPAIAIGDCPDLGPILFAVAAAMNGGVFSGTRRLRLKESDRAGAMAEELRKFGTSVTVYEDSVVVYPAAFHAPTAPLCGHNDHRIVMALSVILSLTGGEITGAQAVRKSFPEFFDHLRALGLRVEETKEA